MISADHQRGFIILNAALLTFGVWCVLVPVRRDWPSARAFLAFWIVIELIKGVGHPLWSVIQRDYTPGLLTAPLLLVTAIELVRRLMNPIAVRAG